MKKGVNLRGAQGGFWTADTHEQLYKGNLNKGLGRFIAGHLAPEDMLEFGSGVCRLANYIAGQRSLGPSYCIEPDIKVETADSLNLLNINILEQPAPQVLNKRFDLVLSIEVAEHIDRERHEEVFDFLVARAGRWIVFSGARPGQGGHGHVAERPELEWRAEFETRGCTFDARLTALARTACDQKNINHRQNVQVFRAPERSTVLETLEARVRPYLTDLTGIIQANGGWMTGGLFYVNLEGARGGMPDHSLHWKRENLVALAQNASNILEIGFAGGHGALLMLLANPKARLTVLDPMQLPYARPCFDYLQRMFPGRLTLESGVTPEALPGLQGRRFDLVHLDGGKEKTIREDLAGLGPLLARDHVLVIDDTQNAQLAEVVTEHEEAGSLDATPFRDMNDRAQRARWTHRICRLRDDAKQVHGTLRNMQRLYETSAIPSVFTTKDAEGRLPGNRRARGLILALQEVERLGLTGAFVEVGVAAGHSSVLAALAASRYLPRDFYLYDTFSGFPKDLPDERDHKGVSIRQQDLSLYKHEECSKPAVEARLVSAGHPRERLFLLQGKAEETLPRVQPPAISILRLDADLFAPTYAALDLLYDRLEPGGFLIVDDYGHWEGCRAAVDTFFEARGVSFREVSEKWDYTCRVIRR